MNAVTGIAARQVQNSTGAYMRVSCNNHTGRTGIRCTRRGNLVFDNHHILLELDTPLAQAIAFVGAHQRAVVVDRGDPCKFKRLCLARVCFAAQNKTIDFGMQHTFVLWCKVFDFDLT